jgi:hypothetical protein
MNLINCRVKLNDYHVGSVDNVTPAEVVVLRHLHDRHAGGNCIVEANKAGKALMHVPGEDGQPSTIRDRTSQEEYNRLRAKYQGWSAPDKPGTSFLDDLFPGVKTGAQALPTSFEALPPAIGLAVEVKEAKKPVIRTQALNEPQPVNETEAAAILAQPVEIKQSPEPEDTDGADLSGPVRPTRGNRRKDPELVNA